MKQIQAQTILQQGWINKGQKAFFFLFPEHQADKKGSEMKRLLTICSSEVGCQGWFPTSDACILLWSWSTGSEEDRNRRNEAGGESTKSPEELKVWSAWCLLECIFLNPELQGADKKKKFPSPEVQEEGTHQHVFAIKLRQFDSPTAHPLCHYVHLCRSGCSHPSLIAALKY